jgi:glycosyl transferase family 2
MNASPPVTVALITYNHEPFVADAVESILRQTYGDFELVVMDDGSTDRTGDVVRGIRDARLVYLRQDNQGPSEARNTALRAARGAIVAQMSGDDVAEPRRLERQLEALRERRDTVVFAHCTPIDERGQTIDVPALDQLINRPNWSAEETLRHLFVTGNCFLAPSAVAPRAAFACVGPYKATLLHAQDYDMWTRFLLRGYHAFVVQERLLRYRVRGASLSAHTPENGARMFFELPRILREYLSIASAARLAAIFPEVETLGFPMSDDLVPFLLAMLVLARPNRGRHQEQFAAEVLLGLMDDPGSRQVIADKARFGMPDLFRILGTIEAPAGSRLRALRSKARRLVRPWREPR